LARGHAIERGHSGANSAPESVEESLGGVGVFEQRRELIPQRRVVATVFFDERGTRVARQLAGALVETLHLGGHTALPHERDRSRYSHACASDQRRFTVAGETAVCRRFA
jgi:hypothetical protein